MTIYNDQISAYINDLFVLEDEALIQARLNSPKRGLPAIQVKPEEGRFIQLLVRACGAKKALEIGSLGGYSGIWIARGLAAGSKLITLEVNPLHAQVAEDHFMAAGVSDRVDIRVGDAHQMLATLVSEGPFDFIFIDAEKSGYNRYLDWALDNVRLGGVIAIHNAFRKGSVADLHEADPYTAIMQEFNRRFAAEPRLVSSIFPAGDGTLVGVKVSE